MPKAYGRMVFWEGASLWVLGVRPGEERYPRTDAHTHHALQATFALRGQFDLSTATGRVEGGAAIVATDVEHTFEATELVALLFVDPEGRVGRALTRAFLNGVELARLPISLVGDLLLQLTAAFERPVPSDEELIAIGRLIVARLGGAAAGLQPDVRVRRMLAFVLAHLAQPVSLGEVAGVAGLSAGRARHLFVEHTGLPFKTYLLWLRLTKATEAYASGASLTESAHVSGFSDSAHLSRTFRRMFGVSAATLRVDSVQP